MAAAVYFLCSIGAFVLFLRVGRKLAEPLWNRHRIALGVLISVGAFGAALFWPLTGVLAIIAWVIGLAFNPPTGWRLTDPDIRRRVGPGLAASVAFTIALVAFVGLSEPLPTASGRTQNSADVVESTAPMPGLAPQPPVTSAAPAPPAPVVPLQTGVPAPRSVVSVPTPAPAPPALQKPAPQKPALQKPAPQKPAPRVVAPAPDTSSYETASCGGDYYRNSDGNCVHRPVEAPAAPAGATAQCEDGTYSFSQHRRGTCSGHGGVARWL